MKVVLVDSILLDSHGGFDLKNLQPQLGLISLAKVLQLGGHEPFVYSPMLEIASNRLPLDQNLYDLMAEHILGLSPDVVGFTTLGCNFIVAVQVAKRLKETKEALPVILGGPHATVLDETIMKHFKQFDFIVLHEAEAKILPLVEGLSAGDRKCFAPGVTWRDGDQILTNAGPSTIENLEDLPFPAYSQFPIRDLKPTFLRVEAGRGCPFHCAFCSTATFFGRAFRIKSAPKLCEEIRVLRDEYDISRFSLQHDLFTVNRRKVLEFCGEVESLSVTWTCSARIDCVDADLLTAMSLAGCRGIYFGVETGSPRMQLVIKKRLKLELLFSRLDAAIQGRIEPTVSFIVGYPQEKIEDFHCTLDLIGDCLMKYRSAVNLQLHLLTPEPGTELYTEYGELMEFDGYVSDFNFPFLVTEDTAIVREHPDVFMTHYYYPSLVPRALNIVATSAFHALLEFGAPFCSHIISLFGGKLSTLIDSLYDWTTLKGIRGELAPPDVGEFLCARFGPDHYVSACVNHLLTCIFFRRESFRTTLGGDAHVCSTDTSEKYRLRWSPFAKLVRDIHNCPAILQAMHDCEALSESDVIKRWGDERVSFLMVRDRNSNKLIRNFVVDRPTALVLELLRNEPSEPEFLGALEQIGIPAEETHRLRGDLYRVGCLLET